MRTADLIRLIALAAIRSAAFLLLRILALTLPSGYSAIINAASPLWDALFLHVGAISTP